MKKYTLSILALTCLLASCLDDNGSGTPREIVESIDVIVNPSRVAPLTAQINVTTSELAAVQLRVVGQNGAASDVVQFFPELSQNFEIPVLGLYPSAANVIELRFVDANGAVVDEEELAIQTEELISDMPRITVDFQDLPTMAEGFNLVNYFGFSGQFLPQKPLMFDAFGDIRWYLDFTNDPTLSRLFFDNGLNLMANGNFIMGNGTDGNLYEIDRLGQIANSWSLKGYGFHHTVIEKPNGNFLVTVNDFDKPTREDVILEIDRSSGDIVNTWDLNNALDNSRRAWPTDLADLEVDWLHANGLYFSASDNSLVVSGRTQGTIKLRENNEVVWIIAPHRGWNTSGNGADLSQFLLQPLDREGNPINDPGVLEGTTNHPDFEWPWYQHSPVVLPSGNIMVFDNGDNRNYLRNGPYSRAVEYKIDEENKTIQQVWTYGKERGQQLYSRIVSRVQYLESENNIIYSPGAVNYFGDTYAKVLEIDRLLGQVYFEATIDPPRASFGITAHNILRVPLYPN